MRARFARLDLRTKLGIVLVCLSTIMLVTGVAAILVAGGRNSADLPHQGSIEEIVGAGAGLDSTVPASRQPAPAPVRLGIPRLYIDAPIVAMGLDANRVPQVPNSADQVAWYGDFSLAPGQGGNAVMSGHVDWETPRGEPIPGVFYRLRELELGDELLVTLEDGAKLRYRVTGNVAVQYDDPNVAKAMGPTSNDDLTLVTCGGTWVRNPSQEYGGNYSHRVLVRAERVIESVGARDVASDRSP